MKRSIYRTIRRKRNYLAINEESPEQADYEEPKTFWKEREICRDMMDGREENKIDSAVEAVLFAYGDPISIEDLCYSLDREYFEVTESIRRLMDYYDSGNRGYQLVKLENSYQFCTREEYAPFIRNALHLTEPDQIGRAAIEVLLIIANFQPTTQRFIDDIRGIDSSYWISWLIEHELIEPVGKLDRRGQPRAYATTLEFLRMFHLSSLSEVPEIGGKAGDKSDSAQNELHIEELAAFLEK